MKKDATLIMYTMSYYSEHVRGVVNRNIHIIDELDKKKYFSYIIIIDFPSFNIRSALRTVKSIYAMNAKKFRSEKIFNSRLYTLSHKKKLLILSPYIFLLPYKLRERVMSHIIRQVIKKVSTAKFSIAWSCNPMDSSFLDKKIFSQTIFDVIDDWRYHSVYKKKAKRIHANYAKIAQKADVIFTVSIYLQNLFKDTYNRNTVYLIPNTSTNSILTGRKTVGGNKIVYVGTIERRLDFTLVELLIRLHPSLEFTFIGRVWKREKKKFQRLLKFKNVVHMGEVVAGNEGLQSLPQFDVGIIPHCDTKFSHSNDPLKAYDYILAGLAVVSTIPTAEKRIERFIYLGETHELFKKEFLKAINEDSEKLIFERKAAMKPLSWGYRVDEMLSYMK